MKTEIVDSKFLELFKQDAVKHLSRMHPEWCADDIEEIVLKEMKKSFSNPDVLLDNNYTGQSQDTKLLTVVDWYLDRKPILAGNGTFFKRHDESINPTASMLDWFLSTRKNIKNEMFSLDDETSLDYILKDLSQSIWKVNANSYYGGSGMPSSAFYNKYCAASTTATAQSVISTCYSTFEAFLADNFLFYDINECFDWLGVVIDQIAQYPETDPWLCRHTADEVFEKLKGMFLNWKKKYTKVLKDYLARLDEETLSRIYYKNRLYEFTKDHKEICHLHNKIMKNVAVYPVLNKKQSKEKDWKKYIPKELAEKFGKSSDYNRFATTESFMNPNNTPDSIKKDMEKLSDYYMKYVYTQYMVFDRIYRLKNLKRKTVVIIDTDSNILALDEYVSFIRSILTKTDKPIENEEFIIVNTIAYILTQVITDTLLRYGECANVPEEYRPIFNMKNEYFMRRLIIATVKKRYMSLFRLREGNLLDPPVTDIKGFDFMKASTSDICEEKFIDIIERHMLKSDKIDVVAVRNELRDMENEIVRSIQNGELEYLPNASVKELAAYKEPGSEQSVRGMLSWNYIYPDRPIEIPSKVKIVKLMLLREEDVLPLKRTDPEIYDVIINKIFNDRSGIFVTEKMVGGKVKRNVKGFQILAIPGNTTIPEWVRPFIDYNSMVSSILSPFKSVTDLLKMNCVTTGFNINGINRKNENFTNIITF